MTALAATQAKNQFGRLLDSAQREPVTIEKQGRPVAVMLSKFEYDRIQAELQDLRSDAETAWLMRGANGERLTESIAQLEAGDVVDMTPDELDALIDAD
ncbi:type II toxin-antitoxin system Phd/YefM family antitoxin [Rubrivirga sp. S365]|uniref:type II toxin-antitoxin system Phd/YefM family antitoxin n=1 Tax=Rubrivirga sp. S365 TaxID=3076080 RepID=UPI0028C67EA6|nr:type II toxin-antitoxin system Phd/YefM family antitoxin [Rubrivirga sp. S365]MDT7858330.1 type II toxin-antitoxin system Phd/YefM family antitoxin [Rubrivirga sp. S365]